MKNIAQRIKEGYESDDFKSDYLYQLIESYDNNKHEIISRIFDLFNIQNYETEKYLVNFKPITIQQAEQIYHFIDANFDDFVSDFHNHYVGYTSLESVSFWEQCEQLEGLHNHKTKKDYSLKYLKHIFNKEGFYVSRGYAYYDISSEGMHVDLLKSKDLLDNFLLTI